jgi:uncharacterized protein (TIGR03437 family)
VEYQGGLSNVATAPVQKAAPAIFHWFPTPSPLPNSVGPPFQGAIVNQDGTVNSPSNPAARGSIVSLFGTGGGGTSPGGVTGGFAPLSPPIFLTLGVAVQINQYQAQVEYAGVAPTLISGVFQVNVRVPEGVAPGMAGVYLQIGGVGSTFPPFDNSGYVLIAVK